MDTMAYWLCGWDACGNNGATAPGTSTHTRKEMQFSALHCSGADTQNKQTHASKFAKEQHAARSPLKCRFWGNQCVLPEQSSPPGKKNHVRMQAPAYVFEAPTWRCPGDPHSETFGLGCEPIEEWAADRRSMGDREGRPPRNNAARGDPSATNQKTASEDNIVDQQILTAKVPLTFFAYSRCAR